MAVQGLLRDGALKNLSSPSYLSLPQLDSLSLSNIMSSFMPSVRALSKAALTYSQFALLASSNTVSGGSPETCSNPQISCQNTSAIANTCCFNAPGGQLLQTQFWDADPSTGPVDSWTIHGLWPDHCDGTFDSNCDASRAYTNITSILTAAGQTSLLSYMDTYWVSDTGTNEAFWEHEWGKHGTCISTLEPDCYTDYTPQEEVVDFFNKVVTLFKTLPSYTWLSNAGIVPSSTTTYTSADILAALQSPRGVTAVIQCENTDELDEIWYFYDVQGSVQTGTFIPTDPDGATSDCPATGVKYLPKAGSSTSSTTSPTITTSTTTAPGTSPTSAPGTPFSGKGTLQVTSGGQANGCIISAGTWYIGGTCAAFTATASGSGFTLTSSKGLCAIQNADLVCASSVSTATVFTSSAGELAYAENPAFYASSVPSGSVQATVSTATLAQGLTITWKSS
ncbi:hypothetical protein HO173_006153 [Letharia columbiana]|uniref:Ribonuclease T2-like n=1 Tax=Letharia columbiana TaxID=112416 RepID=A0A8H6FVD9_9LECA|nr:uncharacterized protein HO173_006153 [Letharia columbiana]KAF6235470.1 hypothetical protein HO173_006153 [Letharia columbiana]